MGLQNLQRSWHAKSVDDLVIKLAQALKVRVFECESQTEAAMSWGVPRQTVNEIVNERYDRLTLKQLIDIALKSGAAIEIGLYYAQ